MPNKLSRFWQEIKRRRVIHVIIVYATVAFVLIELTDIVAPSLDLPDWTLNFIIILLCVGFPIAIIFSWIYDITLKGIRKTGPIKLANKKGEDFIESDKTSRFENSIAVLPFQDMSPQKDQEYFCDGITEELINVLTHVESLKVIARTSCFAFKDKHKDVREIGKKLDVENLLEGSIQKDNNRLRITAQLIKVTDGSHIWSERFDRDINDLFAIQDEISLAIVDTLKVKLLGEEKAQIIKRSTENLEAYNLYLQGIYFTQMMTPEGYKKALGYYRQALQKDPNFALAYTGLTTIYLASTTYGNAPPHEAYPKIKEYTKKALEIDSNLAEAHSTLGTICMYYDWNWKAAEQEFNLAIQLNPNSQWIHIWYSLFLTVTDRHDEAIVEAERALELDPLSSFINTSLGHAYYYARQYDNAIEKQRLTITMYPDYFLAHFHLGLAYRGKSMIRETIEEYKRAVNLSGEAPIIVSGLACSYYEIGKKEEAKKLIESLELRLKNEYVSSTCFVLYHILRGDHDQAFKWLEQAINDHDGFLNWHIVTPIEEYRIPDEPRFKALLKRVEFEKYHQ